MDRDDLRDARQKYIELRDSAWEALRQAKKRGNREEERICLENFELLFHVPYETAHRWHERCFDESSDAAIVSMIRAITRELGVFIRQLKQTKEPALKAASEAKEMIDHAFDLSLELNRVPRRLESLLSAEKTPFDFVVPACRSGEWDTEKYACPFEWAAVALSSNLFELMKYLDPALNLLEVTARKGGRPATSEVRSKFIKRLGLIYDRLKSREYPKKTWGRECREARIADTARLDNTGTGRLEEARQYDLARELAFERAEFVSAILLHFATYHPPHFDAPLSPSECLDMSGILDVLGRRFTPLDATKLKST